MRGSSLSDGIQQVRFPVVYKFEDQFPEEGVLPCEPRAGEIRSIVARKTFVHESRSGVGGNQLADAVANLFVIGRRESPHHDAHGPDHLHPDMGAADALAGGASPKVGVLFALMCTPKFGLINNSDSMSSVLYRAHVV